MLEWNKEDGNYFLPRVVLSFRVCFFPLIFLEAGDFESPVRTPPSVNEPLLIN